MDIRGCETNKFRVYMKLNMIEIIELNIFSKCVKSRFYTCFSVLKYANILSAFYFHCLTDIDVCENLLRPVKMR